MMADFFISYSRADSALAQRVASALSARGHSVWWDREIKGGDDFRATISRELRSADVVVVIWSKSSVGSSFVCDEADRANKAKKLVPIAFAWDFEIPMGFGQIHVANFSKWRDESAAEEIDDILSKREAIKGGRFRDALKSPAALLSGLQARRNDALALLAKLGEGVGGVSYVRLALGALWCSAAYILFEILAAQLPGGSTEFIAKLIWLPAWWMGFVLVRTLYQFIFLAKNKSAVFFLDEAFVFWMCVSGLISVLLLLLLGYDLNTGFDYIGLYLEQVPVISFLVLVTVGLLRSLFWGVRLAASRL
jgi:hypothetical protein